MTDVAFRSDAFLTGSSTTSAVHSAPAGLADNDIIIVTLYKENANAITPPAGFTELATVTASDSSFAIYAFWKRAASESGTYTFSWTGTVYRVSNMAAYSGALLSGTPTDASTTYQANGAQNNQIACPSITTATDNAMVIAFGANFDYALTAAALSGYTVRERSDVIAVFDALKTPAGATGALTITHASGSSQTAGITIALKPQPAATAVPIFAHQLRQQGIS